MSHTNPCESCFYSCSHSLRHRSASARRTPKIGGTPGRGGRSSLSYPPTLSGFVRTQASAEGSHFGTGEASLHTRPSQDGPASVLSPLGPPVASGTPLALGKAGSTEPWLSQWGRGSPRGLH